MENTRFGGAVASSQDKLQEVLNSLEKIARANGEQNAESGATETISDDSAISAELRAKIERDEAVVREALGMFGVDYDSLIKADNNSVYARAVRANPQILDGVMQSETPVLEALKVAVNFKPYAEFMEKYGDEPEKIREAMRAELADEMKTSASKTAAKPEAKADGGVAFSNIGGRGADGVSNGKKSELTDIFGN